MVMIGAHGLVLPGDGPGRSGEAHILGWLRLGWLEIP